MYATAYGVLRSGWDASDAVQDALAEAYAKIGGLRDPRAFPAWLSRILVNKCNTILRKRRRLVVTAAPPESEAFTYVGREDGLDLMAAVHGLDADHREVVALRYFRDLTLAEIANTLGCPVGTVKSRLNRALGKLGAALGTDDRAEVAQ
ncbi:MAG: RNA polymerase sigma factor [Coriobacteriia bacterium]|nr:RNA polymerase sigma factor [Coriobacteriia bacterium]